jgi:hypothetical protein
MKTVSLSKSTPLSGNGNSARALAQHQRQALGPAGGDVGQHQRLHEAALGALAAVRHEIAFEIAGRRVVPVGEGPHRHAAPHRRGEAGPPSRAPRAARPHLGQEAVDGGRANGEHQLAPLRLERDGAVALERGQQHRDQRLQPLAADPVGGLPQRDHRRANGFVVPGS